MARRFFILCLLMLCCDIASAQLFNLETRKAAGGKRYAMEFLERYFVDLLTQRDVAIERKMKDDKVYFRKGSISDLRLLSDTIPYSLELCGNYYDVKWLRNGQPFVNIVFPAQYDLLLGMNQEEAQQKLKETILAAPARDTVRTVPDPKDLHLQSTGVWMLKTDTFQLASLHNGTYYYNNVKPVFDDRHLEYSAANLFAGLLTNTDYRVYVEQSVYGLQTVNYSIMLSQWLNYCAEWGLKTFFAVEEKREDGLLAIVIARSEELGFNHLLSVVIPDKFTTDKNAVLKVRLTPYIPTHNLKNLYQQQSSRQRKIKWQ